jgi:hypothetical protein
MIWVFLVIVIIGIVIITNKNKSKVEYKNPLDRKQIELNLKDHLNEYKFSVSAVHLEPYIFPVINYCKVYDVITLIQEPSNSHDSNAIKVECNGWHIGYVPKYETEDVRNILKKEYIAYIEEHTIYGHINVNVNIRYN